VGYRRGAAAGKNLPHRAAGCKHCFWQRSLMGCISQGAEQPWLDRGKNVTFEYRLAEQRFERLPELAAELVRLKVDLIVATGRAPALAAKSSTATIPIVMMAPDPVGEALVASLARPGGNVTGLSNLSRELATKRLEILNDTVRKLVRVGYLQQAQSSGDALLRNDLMAAAPALKLKLVNQLPKEYRAPCEPHSRRNLTRL